MAKKQGPRINIMLLSTGTRKDGKKTGSYFTTSKNTRNTEKKLELSKYDPLAWDEDAQKSGKCVIYKEKKIPK